MSCLSGGIRAGLLSFALVAVGCSGGGGDVPGEWATVCENVRCGDGRCVVDADRPACVCNAGTVPEGLHCVRVPQTDPCTPNPCNTWGRMRCVAQGASALCLCNEGRVDVNGVCVIPTPCTPNPCTAPFQSVCVIEGDEARCLCDPGHGPDGQGGCKPDVEWDCDDPYSSGLSDPSEPDSCPGAASPLLTTGAAVEGRSIYPAGDADWYRIDPTANSIYEVRVTSTVGVPVPLYVDAFTEDGATPLAADHRGGTEAMVRFKAADDHPVFVRVKALSPSDTCAYAISASTLGMDDFPDTSATATPLQAGASVEGTLQFDGDADVFELLLLPGQAHEIKVAWSGGGEARLELFAADGTTLKHQVVGRTVSAVTVAKASASVFMRVTAQEPWETGSYLLTTRALGQDDHGDVPGEATPLGANGISVVFNRTADVDVLSFDAVEGHIYSVTCTTSGYGSFTAMLLDESGLVLAQQSWASSALLTNESSASGKRYVQLTASYSPNPGITYSCKLADHGFDDYGDTPDTATAVEVGTGRGGVIEAPVDTDVFSFTATAEHVYRITCRFNQSSYPCTLRLLTSSGLAITSGNTVLHEATTSGTYYVEVASAYSTAGTYSYLIEDLGTDDHADTTAAATPIVVGAGPQWAQLETPGDTDVFSFTAIAGHVYRFECTLDVPSGSCAVRFLSSGGVVLAPLTATARTVTYEFVAAGTYFAQVLGTGYDFTGGPYTFSLQDLGLDDYGDDVATATAISAGAGNGRFEHELDVDTLSFAAQAGHIYRARCTRATAPSCPIALLDRLGAVLTSVWSSYNTVTEITWEASASDQLVLRLGPGTNGSTAGIGTYSYSLEDLGADDHGDTTATATFVTVPMPGPATGALEASGDADVFAFAATGSRIYRVTFTPVTLTQWSIVTRDPNGNAIKSGSMASTQSFIAPASGVYYVEVNGAYGSSTGSYSLIIEDLGTDDHGDNVTSATFLKPDFTQGGEIQFPGDLDYFAVPVLGGRLYRATCTTPQQGGTNGCALAVVTSAGSTVVQGRSTVEFEAPLGASELYLRISSYYTGAVFTYSVVVTDLGMDDHGDSAATATVLKGPGVPASGVIEIAGDLDFFAIALSAGVPYTVSLTGSANANFLVIDPMGTYLWSGNSVSPVTFTPATSGRYAIRVSGGSYSNLAYTLTVQ